MINTYLLTLLYAIRPRGPRAATRLLLHWVLFLAVWRQSSSMPIWSRSSRTPSLHLFLGRPCGLLPFGTKFSNFNGHRCASIRATCPAQTRRLVLISPTIFGHLYILSSSWLYRIRHSPVTSSCTGPKIFLKTFRSKTRRLFRSCFRTLHVSHPYSTTGCISVLYSWSLNFLDRLRDFKSWLRL